MLKKNLAPPPKEHLYFLIESFYYFDYSNLCSFSVFLEIRFGLPFFPTLGGWGSLGVKTLWKKKK